MVAGDLTPEGGVTEEMRGSDTDLGDVTNGLFDGNFDSETAPSRTVGGTLVYLSDSLSDFVTAGSREDAEETFCSDGDLVVAVSGLDVEISGLAAICVMSVDGRLVDSWGPVTCLAGRVVGKDGELTDVREDSSPELSGP